MRRSFFAIAYVSLGAGLAYFAAGPTPSRAQQADDAALARRAAADLVEDQRELGRQRGHRLQRRRRELVERHLLDHAARSLHRRWLHT